MSDVMQADIVTEAGEAGPLGAMDRWIATGRPPSAVDLMSQGLSDHHHFGQGPPPGGWDAHFRHEAAIYKIRYGWFVPNFGFSIPCAEVVEAVREIGAPVVEVAAGTGYWSALLRNAGLDVVATDFIPDVRKVYGFRREHCDVWPISGDRAVIAYPGRTVFLSWPYFADAEKAWQRDMLEQMQPGTHLVLIGEPEGGCTGTRALFQGLRKFELVQTIEIPQFPGIHDVCEIYRKRPGRRRKPIPSQLETT